MQDVDLCCSKLHCIALMIFNYEIFFLFFPLKKYLLYNFQTVQQKIQLSMHIADSISFFFAFRLSFYNLYTNSQFGNFLAFTVFSMSVINSLCHVNKKETTYIHIFWKLFAISIVYKIIITPFGQYYVIYSAAVVYLKIIILRNIF